MTHCISHVCYEAEFVGRFAEGCWCHEDVFEEYQVARVARLCNVRCVCVCASLVLRCTAQHSIAFFGTNVANVFNVFLYF